MGVALSVARRGRPSPNPHVGAVVARHGEIIAVGHHERAGLAHAEPMALEAAGASARGATLYVTLEPCDHQGRTGPCTAAIAAAGVGRVVVGARDPIHPGGVEALRAAGLDVEEGVRAPEAEALVADFVKHARTGTPFVTLKAALTLDGRLATRAGDSKWITGDRARRHAHGLRAENDAVLVGVGTVLADDPRLTVRGVRGVDPVRVVLDSELRTPPTAAVVQHGSVAPTWILHGPSAPPARRRALAAAGVELVEIPRGAMGVDLPEALRELGRRGIVRLLVEGGAGIHGALLDGRLADRAAIYVAPRLTGDADAVPLARGAALLEMRDARRLQGVRVRRFGEDTLFEGAIAHGEET